MPKFHVDRSIEINAPVEQVFAHLNHLGNWIKWSPWLIQDPNVKLDISSDGKKYKWDGKRVGSGKMNITGSEDNKWINYDLQFLKPWKTNSKVTMKTEETSNGTRVTWGMDGNLPLLFFWMKKMTVTFIGMDYDRGLLMLKDLVEKGNVPSKLDFIGEHQIEAINYIGIRTATNKTSLGDQMSQDIQKIWAFVSDKKEMIAGDMFSIYHKWDMIKDKIEYTSGLPFNGSIDNLPAEFVSGTIPTTKVYTLQHTGPYKHLGNAWTTMYGMGRNKEFKMNKKIHPFETYLNDPTQVAENEIITQVHFAVK